MQIELPPILTTPTAVPVPRSQPSRAVELVESRLSAVLGARRRDHAACAAALEEAIALARTDADAGRWFQLPELLGELSDAYEALGRPDDAIAAMGDAIDAGWGGAPDGRCRIAEILMRAGRVEEAAPIWAEVRRDAPDDVWLYNVAGFEYAAADDHETALTWWTGGLRVALDTGDPEEFAAQLLEQRAACLATLGRDVDSLQTEGEDFLRQVRSRGKRAVAASSNSDAPYMSALTGRVTSPTQFPWSWFPADQYDEALRRWPEMTKDGSPAAGGRDHAAYCLQMQARLRDAADEGIMSITIGPVIIDAFLEWCAKHGKDPGKSRADYAAALGDEHPEQLIAWPPGRNELCWCRSGRKYKKCCGTPSAGTDW